ncbi:hypothetical protein F4811DRAFT_551463 [Daldinia bambusicola]|nr:hypothetical protein F4811DRAFT_551463 [Daldinia bambusicola]
MASERKYQEYHLLAPEEEAADELLPPTYESRSSYWLSPERLLPWRTLFAILAVLLLLLVSFTLGYEFRAIMGTTGISPYLNLGYTQTDTLWWNTEYSSVNATDTRLNELWDTHIPWESGIIALTNEEARAMSLPESQSFPWDASRKRIYIVNAHHIIHCVQYRTNKPQTINYSHILHCLNSLRVETMCTADDTPRYVPLNSAHGFLPGDGQSRKCRDWSRVQESSSKRTTPVTATSIPETPSW